MQLTVNGVLETFPDSLESIDALLAHLNLPFEGIMVEVNGQLFQSDWEACVLASGDVVEILHFMGGG